MSRVVWAMSSETAGEFGEVRRGDAGTVVEEFEGPAGDMLLVEWDQGVQVAVEAWMTDTLV